MKRYVADTHAVLWFAAGELARLGRRARHALGNATSGRGEVLISVVSLWEIALLHDEGTIRLPAGFSAWCDALAAAVGIRIEPLTRGDVEAARSLRGLPDPHDRLIAGTAMRLGVPLLTADRRIRSDRGVQTVW